MDALYKQLYECTEAGRGCSNEDISTAFSSSNPYHVWLACKAAGLSVDATWIPELVRNATLKVESNDPDINSVAVWALARIGGDKVSSFWKEASISPDKNERRAAADLIGELSAKDGLNTLVRLLNDKSDTVSSWAALSLAKFGEVSIQALLEHLNETSSLQRAGNCIDAIAKVSPKDFKDIVQPAVDKKVESFRLELEEFIKILELR